MDLFQKDFLQNILVALIGALSGSIFSKLIDELLKKHKEETNKKRYIKCWL